MGWQDIWLLRGDFFGVKLEAPPPAPTQGPMREMTRREIEKEDLKEIYVFRRREAKRRERRRKKPRQRMRFRERQKEEGCGGQEKQGRMRLRDGERGEGG